ncbi:MAG: DNA methyltransferase [Planctomycetota bacterium]
MRLTPAYSVRLVREVLAEYEGDLRVLDPFAGTSTTPLAAVEQGLDAVGVDINPFLVWLGNAKVSRYGPDVPAQARDTLGDVLATADDVEPVDPPPIHNIERWWDDDVLGALCSLRAAIAQAADDDSHTRCLLDVAFCRTMIEVSRASFNHQSMSFAEGSGGNANGRDECLPAFQHFAQWVIRSVRPDPTGNGQVVLGDSRKLADAVDGEFDLVLTSPPYANRMSYIRELRPYMYWLGYLTDARGAGELDWRAIGGTWGVATSRVTDWEPDEEWYEPEYLRDIVQRIRDASDKSGDVLSQYVRKYFYDIWQHIRALKPVVSEGGAVVYIVGNSTFYDVLVPTEELYADMLREAGFKDVGIRVVRKRNSKKELFEYAVEASVGELRLRRRRETQLTLLPET